MSRYTLKSAMEFAKNHDIETWIHLFLNDEGDNVGLSEGLRLKKKILARPGRN